MMTLRPDYILEYLAARLFMGTLQALPLRTALRAGGAAGSRIARLMPGRFNVGMSNLRAAYPDMPVEEAEKIIKDMYVHFGRAVAETAVAHRLLAPSSFREHVQIRNERYLEDVRRAGKGGIFVTAHLGIWELYSIILRNLDLPTTIVYRPLKNPLVDQYLRDTRRQFGQNMIPREGALPKLLRVLRQGGYIALLTDQHAKRDGIWAPFFGRLASTTPAPALLALRTGAPIVTGYVRRAPGTYKFDAFVDTPFHVEDTGDRDADVYRGTLEVNMRIEEYIRLAPADWLWAHKRWRKPPQFIDDKGRANDRPSGESA